MAWLILGGAVFFATVAIVAFARAFTDPQAHENAPRP